MPQFKKYVKRQAGKAGKAVKKRYFKGKGYSNPKLGTMMRDIKLLKSVINAEKQNAEISSTTEYSLAQYNGVSASGGQLINILPIISQGVGEDNRKGDSLKICSWVYKLQIYNNGNLTTAGCNYTFYILRQPTNQESASAGISSNYATHFLEPNTFSGVLDTNSNRDYQHFRDYIVMGVIKGKIKANESADAGQGSKTNNHTLARKQEFHIRYDKGTNTPLSNNLYVLAVASDCDRSTTNKLLFKHAMKVYYYDN